MIYFQFLPIISLFYCALSNIQGVQAFKWPLNKGPFTHRDKISWPLVASGKWSLNQGKIYRE